MFSFKKAQEKFYQVHSEFNLRLSLLDVKRVLAIKGENICTHSVFVQGFSRWSDRISILKLRKN